MSQFTQQERQALYALFSINDHEIREGSSSGDKKKISWFIYIRREAIQQRLDDLFFGEWENGFLWRDSTPNAAHVGMHLTIRGIRREFDGMNETKTDGETRRKGASTDALKRVASMWGIGLYLQNPPMVWTENYIDANNNPDWNKKKRVEAEAWAKFADWLRSIGSAGDVPPPSDPQPSAPQWAQQPAPSSRPSAPAPFPPANKAELAQQIEEYLDQHGIAPDDALKRLHLSSWGAFPNFEVARMKIDEKLLDAPASKPQPQPTLEGLDKEEIPF
jgi:hypothetical protein